MSQMRNYLIRILIIFLPSDGSGGRWEAACFCSFSAANTVPQGSVCGKFPAPGVPDRSPALQSREELQPGLNSIISSGHNSLLSVGWI